MTFILPVTAALPLVFAEALAYITFSACLGLTLGVARANLTWTSELMPIKQSLAVTIALFGGWLYAIAFAGLYLWQGVEARRGCVSRHRGGGDVRGDSAASSLAQNEGRTALCDAVKENKMRECGGRRTAALLLYRQRQNLHSSFLRKAANYAIM